MLGNASVRLTKVEKNLLLYGDLCRKMIFSAQSTYIYWCLDDRQSKICQERITLVDHQTEKLPKIETLERHLTLFRLLTVAVLFDSEAGIFFQWTSSLDKALQMYDEDM